MPKTYWAIIAPESPKRAARSDGEDSADGKAELVVRDVFGDAEGKPHKPIPQQEPG
eukprot:CAMPEP_0118972716 /NCGR_PEP_ID=MMETSP1173-20130426/8946_1 /TAXON_ID=1034831 /ORGANISM="Rhizochromulina marina cf, Strain CCMP1243" /LENGTH=55 /DNA_ID=CAMNT_0006922287 /DNA_START=20 /DNA_END=182 /DNA_ORIENTATION=-